MSPIPQIKGPEEKKPLCYDPARGKFIIFDEIVTGKEKIVPVETLLFEDQKKLVIERNRAGPDYAVQVMSGAKHSRDDVIREIRDETEFGKMSVMTEIMYLTDLLAQIRAGMHNDK